MGVSRRALAALVFGLVLAVGLPLGWWLGRDDPGPVTTVDGASAQALAGPPPSPSALPPPAPAPVVPAPQVPGPGPVEVRIPALDVTAAVVAVGVDQTGAMEVPEDVDTVGWYRYGPEPGAPSGSAVLTGHVDDRDQGRGVFFDLGRMEPGQTAEVVRPDGSVLGYDVVSRERFDKGVVPLDRLFDRGGEPRLVLVTCGGPFDRQTRNYTENIVVTLVPSGGR